MRTWTLLGMVALLVSSSRLPADDKDWIDLFAKDFAAFKNPVTNWTRAESVSLDPKNPRALVPQGEGQVAVAGKGARDLFTKDKYGDLEIQLEFMVPKSSNSGIKFHSHYEIQILDSYGKPKVSGDDCGGIYPRAETKGGYHHIDEGIPPRVNACKKPGEWQTLHIVFQAPRFDDKGKKTANARILKAVLNDQVIHEDVELLHPTGDRWKNPEMTQGALMIQGDHGQVAFRNFRIRPLEANKQ